MPGMLFALDTCLARTGLEVGFPLPPPRLPAMLSELELLMLLA